MSELVIDADVLRSAGTTDHPFSKNARSILEAVRSADHLLVQTAALKTEHDKHQSRFAKTWRANMVARKRWVPKRAPEDPRLRQHLVESQNPDSKKDEIAVLKDAHLLEAAVVSNLRVVSKDTTAKSLFQKGCPLPDPYGRILWADVTQNPDATLEWIANGCPDRLEWQLCQ